CEVDARVGGGYRLVLDLGNAKVFEAYGKYLEVTPHSRLVWTNDEACDAGPVTTVIFEERGGQTLLVVHDLYPSKDALDEAIASGSTGALPGQFEAVAGLLVTRDASAGRA